jgi:6-phosphogluconolactonase
VLSADATLQWLFNDETGTLTPNPVTRHPSRPGAGPRHFVFHPNNRFVFIVHELDATVEACSYDMATGRLEHLQTIDQLPVDDPAKRKSADIQITADGRFLYASERTTSTLTGYAVDGQTGKLEPIGRYVTATHPRGFQIDPRGKFLLCAGQKSASVIVHRIDQQTGSLTELSRHPAGVGACWVEIVEPLP